jgi:ABC-type nitrate/sulfonate/bicarbonate transport system ATPase subunit
MNRRRAGRKTGRKQTIFMVTHDIDEAIYLCDRIVVFTNGPSATIGQVIEVPIPRPAR